jgi:hypothetical protein
MSTKYEAPAILTFQWKHAFIRICAMFRTSKLLKGPCNSVLIILPILFSTQLQFCVQLQYSRPFISYFCCFPLSPSASENRHHLFAISVHRHILSCDLLDRETYRCSLMSKGSWGACVGMCCHGYKAGMRVVSITTAWAEDACARSR